MFLTTKRQRRFIFITCAALSSVLVYEGEATEINTAIQEYRCLKHEMHCIKSCNAFLEHHTFSITVGCEYTN